MSENNTQPLEEKKNILPGWEEPSEESIESEEEASFPESYLQKKKELGIDEQFLQCLAQEISEILDIPGDIRRIEDALYRSSWK